MNRTSLEPELEPELRNSSRPTILALFGDGGDLGKAQK